MKLLNELLALAESTQLPIKVENWEVKDKEIKKLIYQTKAYLSRVKGLASTQELATYTDAVIKELI